MVLTLVTLAMLAVLARVAQLQTQPPTEIAHMLDDQEARLPMMARRGNILDRSGRVLATSGVATRLFVDPQDIKDPNTFSERVGYALGYDPAKIELLMAQRPDSRYIVIDDQVSEMRLAKISQQKFHGAGTEPYLVRHYPHGSTAGQVLGFVGKEGLGLDGSEAMFDRELTGKPGRLTFIHDAQRRALWINSEDYLLPQDGSTVMLSLDLKIQGIAERALREACEQFSARAGQMVIIDPNSGEILAMANFPPFDPNQFSKSSPELRKNKCITDVVEPGSTFKAFVWSKILDGGFAKPEEMVDCGPGVWVSPQGRTLHDAHPVGLVTFDGVLVKSSNIGMAKTADRMGRLKLYSAVKSFGFGSRTGVNLTGESPGMITPLKQWSHYTMTSVPMGQEVGVTPLQMARALCAIANGGKMITPTLRAGDTHTTIPVEERVLSEAAAAHTRNVMRHVVTEGTGKKANSSKYDIFGKTGTAQIARLKGQGHGYEPGAYVSAFIAGAPLENPRMVIACYIHRPDPSKGHFGGTVAAPAAMRAIEQTLEYLGVPPKPPGEPGVPASVALQD